MTECRIFKGATRPPMIGGVPLFPMVILCLSTIQPLALGIIFQFYTLALIAGILFLTVFIWLRLISKHDGWRTKQEFLRMRTRAPKGNVQIWGGVSYGPLRLKKHASP
jgi:type IV secretory pathway VirB3-like protein